MGFFASVGSAISGAIVSIENKKNEPATDTSLFKDFDAERERLQKFDLEASVESTPKPTVQANRRDSGQS